MNLAVVTFYDYFASIVMGSVIVFFLLAVWKAWREDKKAPLAPLPGNLCPKCGKKTKGGIPHDYPCYWYDIRKEESEDV